MTYSAGAFATLIALLAGWMASHSGILAMTGTSFSIQLSPAILYMSLVWGGICAFAYLLPGLSTLSWFQAGLLLALFPAAAELLYLLPRSGFGYFGLSSGWATPVIISALCLIWGWTATLTASKAG